MRLIDADKLKRCLETNKANVNPLDYNTRATYAECITMVDFTETVDAEPVWRVNVKYRKKPVMVDAFKLGVDYIPDWFMDAVTANEAILHGEYGSTNADIHTLEGWIHASFGDYIIRGVEGEIYPCKPHIFKQTYETVYDAD